MLFRRSVLALFVSASLSMSVCAGSLYSSGLAQCQDGQVVTGFEALSSAWEQGEGSQVLTAMAIRNYFETYAERIAKAIAALKPGEPPLALYEKLAKAWDIARVAGYEFTADDIAARGELDSLVKAERRKLAVEP